MRKVIAILMMVSLVVFFYTELQSRQPKNQEKRNKKNEVQNIIDDTKEELGEYPANPIDVVEIHNELINVLYGKALEEKEVMLITEIQRQLYGQEFLALNTIEEQVVQTSKEIFINSEKEIKVIGSQVMNSYNDPPGTMRVQVVHYTNKQDQDLIREYILEEESNLESSEQKQWKIFGWKNIGVVETQEEKE